MLDLASTVLGAVRRAKSDARLSMRADVARLRVVGRDVSLARVLMVLADVEAAGRIVHTDLVTGEGSGITVEVTL